MFNKLLKKLIPNDIMQSPKTVNGYSVIPDLIQGPCEAYAFRVNEALRKAGFYEVEFLSDEKEHYTLKILQDNISDTRLQAIKDFTSQGFNIVWKEMVKDD